MSAWPRGARWQFVDKSGRIQYTTQRPPAVWVARGLTARPVIKVIDPPRLFNGDIKRAMANADDCNRLHWLAVRIFGHKHKSVDEATGVVCVLYDYCGTWYLRVYK